MGTPEVAEGTGFRHNRVTTALFVRELDGTPIIQFQSDGNVLLHSNYVSTGQSGIQADLEAEEFYIKNRYGSIVAKMDSNDGLTLAGSLYQNWGESPPISSPDWAEFIVRSATDPAGYARIVIDSVGNLKTRGRLYTPSSLP